MARGKWINKKTAAHFTLVHRPQNDPLIHDESVSPFVFNPTVTADSNKSIRLDELASELGSEVNKIRENEGEAAIHGIYFDDTEYDYMQHMRDSGNGSGESYYVEAPPKTASIKKKDKPLESALKDTFLEGNNEKLLDVVKPPSKNLRQALYQAQQDIPDALAGLQPDMDPRLREVLIALEDDAYIDDEDHIFSELAKDGEEIDQEEFDQSGWNDEETGWDSDTTAKPSKEYRACSGSSNKHDVAKNECEGNQDEAWMKDFEQFKREHKSKSKFIASSLISSALTNNTNGSRRKKRKGALTNSSSYSMTSSSLLRTEGYTTLDARFEKVEEQYNENMSDMASVSQSSSASISSVEGPIRNDFDSIMDEFLVSFPTSSKKSIRQEKYQDGIKQLEEIRRGLGPAIVRT